MRHTSTSPPSGAFAGRMRRWVYQLRTEGGSPARDAAAIGLGVFIGCSPFYGLHLAICWLAGKLLRLNRLKMYLAANISNPLMAPFLVLTELQTGAWIRRGSFHRLTLDTLRETGPWVFGADILIGSLIVGGALGGIAALATWLGTRSGRDPVFAELVRRASDRYVATSITAWEFARGKLRGDPLYRTVLTSGMLPSGGLLVDVGCGQGLMLALLAEAALEWRQRTWPSELPAPPLFDRLAGIELRPHVAALARRALAGDAEIVEADARTRPLERCRAVLLFDVLHLMPKDDQDRLLRSVFAALDPGGVILVREADAAAGWRFQAVRFGNAFKAVVFGRWRQSFHFRTADEWRTGFQQAGFHVDARDTSGDTPFGNVLFVLSRQTVSA
jgi:uncharacterized protein (DUF2062 family)